MDKYVVVDVEGDVGLEQVEEIRKAVAQKQRRDLEIAVWIAYMEKEALPQDGALARKIKREASQFVLEHDVLFKIDNKGKASTGAGGDAARDDAYGA